MQLFLAAAPEHTRQALAFTANLAHGAYSIGPEGTLICRGLGRGLRGGILLLGDGGCGSIGLLDLTAENRELVTPRGLKGREGVCPPLPAYALTGGCCTLRKFLHEFASHFVKD